MLSLYFSMLFLVVYNYVCIYIYAGITFLHILNVRSSMDDKQQVLAIRARGWERLGLTNRTKRLLVVAKNRMTGSFNYNVYVYIHMYYSTYIYMYTYTTYRIWKVWGCLQRMGRLCKTAIAVTRRG